MADKVGGGKAVRTSPWSPTKGWDRNRKGWAADSRWKPADPPLAAGKFLVDKVLASAGIKMDRKQYLHGPHPKGIGFTEATIRSKDLMEALHESITRVGLPHAQMPPGGIVRFEEQVLRTFLELKDTKITASALVGQYFEFEGPRMPGAIMVLHIFDTNVRLLADDAVAKGTDVFMDGRMRPVKVTKPFDAELMAVRDLRIRLKGQAKGVKYCDHAAISHNADDQHLLRFGEDKTRGAKEEIPGQMAKVYERMDEVRDEEGAMLTFTVVDPKTGVETPGELPLDKVVHMPDVAYSRVGVVAGAKFKVAEAKDKKGQIYYRVTVNLPTDLFRLVFTDLLRDPRWKT
ncbi:hypothetical protein O1Q96_01025 (plasmid) [Streptomyces sp. Qhu-G9]|uniref:hypothetical protein n=1 Tax=Streptomyces sp. Qhu-G9 TaxID=3452799 RepID=UPI0022AC0B47|nr:hypothetical protein [Streptomyces aurantiacus]WAU78452.1 hypothetical protein O1Q96_01025 [Streptomyces aurantiacus]